MRTLWKILIGVLIVLAVLVTLNTITVNHETKSAEVNIPGARILQVPGGDIQVKEDGARNAPPLVLLHGYAGAMNWFDKITPLLARNHRVIRIDLLGHGGSQKPAHGYSMENQGQLVAQVLTQLGVQHPVIVGFSLGGEVAGALTASSPQLVSGLVLIDTAPDKSYWNTPLKQKVSRVPVIGQTLWRILPDSQVKQGYEIAFAKGYPVPDFAVEDYNRMTYSSYKDSFRSAKSFISEEPLDTRLSPTAVPLLVIFGAEDRSEDPSAAQHYDSVPGAQIQLVQGSGHSPMIEKPAETAKLIEDFAEPLFAGLRRQQAKAAAKRRQAGRAKRQAARQKQRKARQAKRKQKSKSG